MKSIYDMDKVSVLMDDYCTKREAEKHVKAGACIWSPEDFVKDFVMECDDPEEVIESLGCSSANEVLEKCKAGELRADCISSGFYRCEDDLIPYVITYVL